MRKERKKRSNTERYFLRMIMLLSLFLMVVLGLFVYAQLRIKKAAEEERLYTAHYVYIGKSAGSYTSNMIYKEARSYGKRRGIYVENLKSNPNVNYSDAEYVKMAAAMHVDGIIVEATDIAEMRESINEAVNEGIPTITMLSDCPGCRRRSFIELGNYNIGREYGRIIINLARTKTPTVTVLMDEESGDSNQELLSGIRETLENEGNHLTVNIRIEAVDGSKNFRVTDKAREILSDKQHPDFLVCANGHDTELVYQAIRDYNLSGSSAVIGTGFSESLLIAVRDGDIAALVDANTEQAGMLAVQLLQGFHETGSIADRVIIEDTVIDKDNVGRYLTNE